jgi:hypothetical protein
MTRDEWRSARLLFGPELAGGDLDYAELARPEVFNAVRSQRFPGPVRRFRERLAQRRGKLDLGVELFNPLMHARRTVLGDAAYGSPRVLVRVDEFPHCQAADDPSRFGTESYRRFHELLKGAGIPYLAAVLTRVSNDPYNPSATGNRALDEQEIAFLKQLKEDGVEFATHGFDHRTRFKSGRRHSELMGLSDLAVEKLLDRAGSELRAIGLAPKVFVPPYNRFSAGQYPTIAARYDVVCGGPESVGTLGFHRAPLWRGDAVYFPSYAPFYGRAEEAVDAIAGLAAMEVPIWAQVTLHWGWEAKDSFASLERSLERLASFAQPWSNFLGEVAASRDAVDSAPATRLLASPARRRPGYGQGRSARVA